MRRSLVVASALALVTAGSLGASADTPASLYPKAGCNVFTDPAGDAQLVGPVGVASQSTPAGNSPKVTINTDPSSKSFDITGVSYRMSADTLTAAVRVPGLQDAPGDRGTGDTWISRFTVNKHLVEVTVSRFSPRGALDGAWDQVNPVEYLNAVTVDGKDVRATGVVPGGEFDSVRGLVMISVDRAGLEKAVKAPLTDLTALEVEADTRIGYSVARETKVDGAAAPTKLVLNADDNGCFV